MRVVYDPEATHLQHAPTTDTYLGRPIPFYDVPVRLTNVEQHLRAILGDGAFVPFTDHGLVPIRRIHRSDYLYFLKNIYGHWQELGGNEVSGVMPDTFVATRPYRDYQRRSEAPIRNFVLETLTTVHQVAMERLWAFYTTLFRVLPAYPPPIIGDAIDDELAPFGAGNLGFLDCGNPGYYTYDVGAATVAGERVHDNR